MKNGFIKKNKILGINMLYLLGLLPVIIFSYYKNGFMVFKSGELSFFLSLQYLVIPIIIILLSYVFETYYYLGIKKEENTNNVVNSIVPYMNALCYLVCGPANKLYITIPIIVVIDVLLKFIDTKVAVNRVALFKCILFGLLTLLSTYTNANYHELTLNSSVTDPSSLFLGMGVGEIGTTSTLCALIGFIVLMFNTYYKKEIPIVCVVSYALVGILLYFAGVVKFNELLINTFTSGFMFVAIFVASLSTATPVVRSGRVIYALLVGILSAVMINVFNFNLGMYIVILVCGLLTPVFNKFKLSIE